MAGKEFFELVKAIGESKSKQEEDRIITEEVAFLKKKIVEPGISKKKMKELVTRAMYVEMLGLDAGFAYIRAVELCASTNIHQKRAGFLAASLFLSPEHEFRFMLVNQIQRDMNSSNQLEQCAALSAVCKIVNVDMIPAVIGDVIKLMKHEMDAVRKRSVSALHRLYQMDKECITEHVEKIRRVLCDREPSVMGASLPFLYEMIQDRPSDYKDLVPSFVSILKQIVEHRLPRDFDYHRIPGPWIQMDILKILGVLGRGDQASSEGMYEVLVDVMRRADTGINVGYAIVYEAVRTVTTIYPNPLLLDSAATAISRFIRSESHNLKYIGIKGLAAIVSDHPKYAVDHQLAVIDCLEDPDETLKRKTLDLLFRMTNSVNVEFIVDKLLTSLSSAKDDHFRTDLVNRITQCAERFAPSNAWYVETMVRVFELAGDKVKMSVAQTLMQLIAEGSEEDEDDSEQTVEERDTALRREAVENFLVLLDRPKLPDVLAQCLAWVVGEYGYLSSSCTKENIIEDLCNLANQNIDTQTRSYVITAIMKLVAQNGSCPQKAIKLIEHFFNSSSLDVYQRCVEFKALLKSSAAMADSLPVDASCEDIEVDASLSMLNNYVQRAIANGAAPYTPPVHALDDDNEDSDSHVQTNQLRFNAYERAAPPPAPVTFIATSAPGAGNVSQSSAMGVTTNLSNTSAPDILSSPVQPQLQLAKGVSGGPWGKKVEPAPAPAPSVPVPYASPVNTVSEAAKPVSSVSPVTAAAAPVAASAPRVPSEKEKMAAALFGGMGSTGSKAVRRTSATQPVQGYAAPAQITTSAPVVASPPSSAQSSVNLLDVLGDPVSIPVSTPPQQSQSSSSSFAMDLLNDLGMVPINATPPPVPVPQRTSQSVTPSVFDAFDGLLTPVSSASVAISQNLGVPAVIQNPYIGGGSVSTLKPLQLTTNEFGMRWGHTPCEYKQSTPCRLKTLAQLRSVIEIRQGVVQLGHVESIAQTNESIFACSLASSPGNLAPLGSLVLVHIKLNAVRMDCVVTVKSSSKELCNEQVRLMCEILSQAVAP